VDHHTLLYLIATESIEGVDNERIRVAGFDPLDGTPQARAVEPVAGLHILHYVNHSSTERRNHPITPGTLRL
jgi:hypothetical protein